MLEPNAVNKMHICINLVAVSTGGGLQNALSFLHFLAGLDDQDRYLVMCTRGSAVHEACLRKGIRYQVINQGFAGRLSYELYFGNMLIKQQQCGVVFSLFGGAPLVSCGAYKIAGFAYSNIIQREVPFWNFLPWYSRFKKHVVDAIRYIVALQADELIVETEYLKRRALSGVFRGKTIHVVKMAPSVVVTNGLKSKNPPSDKSFVTSRNTIDILYLSGPHPNKRIHCLGAVFSRLNKGRLKFRLLTTIASDSTYLELIRRNFEKEGALEALVNYGPVDAERVAGILRQVDGLINVALLESFSNNWVEAWAAEIPLFVTDAEWARESCGDGAVYVDPCFPSDAATKISHVFQSSEALQNLKHKGMRQLARLPAANERFEDYLCIIDDACSRLEHKS